MFVKNLLKLPIKSFYLSIIFLCAALTVTAQSDNINKNAPVLIDKFGIVNSERLSANLDYFASELQKIPNSTATIIVRRGANTLPGFMARYGIRIQTYLVEHRGIDAPRISVLNLGLGQTDMAQLILVPPGYEPHGDSLSSQEIDFLFLKQPFKFDEFWYQLPNEDDGGCCIVSNYGIEEKNASLDALAARLKNNERINARLVFYSYKCVAKDDCSYPTDSPKLAGRTLRREKKYLVKQHKIAPSRIEIVNGGYKSGAYPDEARRLELWLINNPSNQI